MVSSFTQPGEINSLVDALEYYRRNARLLASLPKSAPRKMRNAYMERMAVCTYLINREFQNVAAEDYYSSLSHNYDQ